MNIQMEKLPSSQSGCRRSVSLFNKLDIHFNQIRVFLSPSTNLQKNDSTISELLFGSHS